MSFKVFFLALLLIASPFLQVARSDAEPATEAAAAASTEEYGGADVVNDESQAFDYDNFSPATGVDTVCVFPKNSAKLVSAGEESELLVGIKYDGESSVNIIGIKGSVYLPFDHRMLVQNLTTQVFNNASVPPATQATFPYVFAVSKYLQAGTFDLVGTIIYEIDQQPYQNTFYNGTIEVVEPSGMLSIETVFLVMLGVGLVFALGLWVRGQIQHLSKKSKRTPKVEIGTRSTDASLDEWLQGTSFTQSQSIKSKKKK